MLILCKKYNMLYEVRLLGIVSLLFLNVALLRGQNYSLFSNLEEEVYYTNDIGYLKAMRVDSTQEAAGYKIHHTFRTKRVHAHSAFPTPYDSIGGSWLGKQIYEDEVLTIVETRFAWTISFLSHSMGQTHLPFLHHPSGKYGSLLPNLKYSQSSSYRII